MSKKPGSNLFRIGSGWKALVVLILGVGVIASVSTLSRAGELQDEALRQAKAKLEQSRNYDRYVQAWTDLYVESFEKLQNVDFEALRRAVEDLTKTFPETYSAAYLSRLDAYEKQRPDILMALTKKDDAALDQTDEIVAFQREALLANPLLDFDKLLVIKRKPIGDSRRSYAPSKGLGEFLGLPRQSSWQMHSIPKKHGWDNEIAVLSSIRDEARLTTLFKPSKRRLVSDMDLHFDADKLIFSMADDLRLWQIFEIDARGKNLRQLTPGNHPDVHNYDSAYLPNGRISFVSTAPFQGVPCNAGLTVGMSYLMDGDGKNIRQVAFDQDHNYNPTVMNDGRILYLRWEYTDIPHVWARYLFTMNPDGTNQRSYYGSGSYWPNSIFYARAIPGHPTKVVGVITGHHVGRVGELILFDPAKGSGIEGVVQRIPGWGKKVEPLIEDRLTINTYPKFLHPYPLNENYFVVAAKPAPNSLWGIYLVDTFDNMTLLKEVEGYALLEPIPFRATEKPPVIPDKIDLERDDAIVYIPDVYRGRGLKGVPRGAVKNLRLYTYHFAYQKIAGINHRVGADGPWEPKQVMGVVPVEEDGSALFRIPAKTPISIQPLDSHGQALQLMRSWMTAQPGEFVSCTGCHESQNASPVNRVTQAIRREPSEIVEWRGPTRGFSFKREVQPVLDRYCVNCHDGEEQAGQKIADLRANQGKLVAYKNSDPRGEVISGVPAEELVKKYGAVFSPSYVELRKYVRVGGLESDLRGLNPTEFHANTTELVQMLKKGHYGVELSTEAWDRITTWIDLNAPAHGTWTETVGIERTYPDHDRRRELRELYADFQIPDPEADAFQSKGAVLTDLSKPVPAFVKPVAGSKVSSASWPFDALEAKQRQAAGKKTSRRLNLGNGVELELVYVPAGEFVMGDAAGERDEQPLSLVKVEKGFWMARFETTNEQYAQFDSNHDSRYEHKGSWMFNEWDLGWAMNSPKQPVVRVSQQQARAFANWLSEKIGEEVTLPTEAQWEYACRAGTNSPLSFGTLDSDFSKFANMADWTIRELVYDVRNQFPPDLVPRDTRFNDNALVTTEVGSYRPNAWGLHDMHGNVWEWTRTAYKSYPYVESDGRNVAGAGDEIVARGGSWYDRPKRSRSAFRLNYPAWQQVYNVGFRVIIETDGRAKLNLASNEDE